MRQCAKAGERLVGSLKITPFASQMFLLWIRLRLGTKLRRVKLFSTSLRDSVPFPIPTKDFLIFMYALPHCRYLIQRLA